jgi:demethylmenaquinone methyltransferase/2-methoxy-6-polyprenyl-1,4-benzoquinol methylase
MSLGRDASWKRTLVASLPDLPSPLCVDLACGTGDLTSLLSERYPGGKVVGLDLAGPMLALARRRNRRRNVRFTRQDMTALGFPAGVVDVVTGGYALRNAPELGPVLDEILRILKPGGVAAFLDFAKPATRCLQAPERWLLAAWCGIWGIVLHADPGIHGGYIAASLSSFPDRSRLRELIVSRGFEPASSRKFFLGITELVVFRKRKEPEGRSRPAAT